MSKTTFPTPLHVEDVIRAVEEATQSVCLPGAAANGYDEYFSAVDADKLIEALRRLVRKEAPLAAYPTHPGNLGKNWDGSKL